MKNLFTLGLGLSLLIFGGLACKNNPLTKFTKKYNCTVAGEPDPQSSEDFVKRGRKHLELNNYTEQFDQCAFDAAQEAVRLDPQNAEALALRGFLYRANRDYDAALEDLNQAIKLAPDNSFFYNIRSSIYEKKNMLDKAIEDLSFVLKTSDSHYDYARRGSLYFKKEDFENALKDYTEAIRLKPDYENHYTMRAEVYRKLGKQAEAEADELKAKEFEDSTANNLNAPANSNSTNNSSPRTISGGVLNGKATNLVQPTYPPAAKAVRASGAVNVQVTIDEKGNVVSASAVSGHPLLRASAVAAARESKFSPTLLGGKAVKVTGIVVYNFVP
ncbi:MAG TPA: TonB family protein [Pyrinomonadaceae bacterium]|nr:TonB family protein [Pyrinomonadaceae bacterium]